MKDPKKIAILKTEIDEIFEDTVQVVIIDGTGEVLIDTELAKPLEPSELFDNSEEVAAYAAAVDKITKILDAADLVVVYGIDDLAVLEMYDITVPDAKTFDVMVVFTCLMVLKRYYRTPLARCMRFYGYGYRKKYGHDYKKKQGALADDARAILYAFCRVRETAANEGLDDLCYLLAPRRRS